ncbi:hypothetical protein [Streptomyces sp. NPDC057418]
MISIPAVGAAWKLWAERREADERAVAGEDPDRRIPWRERVATQGV